MRTVAVVPSQLHRLSPEEYRRLVEAGVFDEDARVELIEGLIVDMSPKTRAHENAIAWLNEFLFGAVDLERFQLRVGAPLTLATSEPEPDLIVIDRAAPRPNHPATAALVIEVAVSSRVRDLVEKPPIYARAGVPVYWVVDLDSGEVIAHTGPSGDRYTRIDSIAARGELHAEPLVRTPIAVADLLAAAAR
jgi:Uma2 family endonuclease